MTLLDLLLLSAATWVISYLIVKTSAPFNALGRFRDWATARSTLVDGTIKPGSIGEWVSCIYCVATISGIGVYLLWLTPLQVIIYPLAISGMALMLHRYTGGFHT